MAVATVVSVTSPTETDLDIFGSRIDDGVRESAQSWRDLARSRAPRLDPRAISRENHVDDDGEDRRRSRFGDSDYTWLERDLLREPLLGIMVPRDLAPRRGGPLARTRLYATVNP